MANAVQEARKSLLAEMQRLQGLLKTDRSRRRASVVRRLHEIRSMLDGAYRYSSQAGQDFVVDSAFKQKRGGVFLDVGGYDGVTGSNTFFLEVFRGWKGALIEPVPAQLVKAEQVRRCPCLGVAVAAREGEADFIEITEGYTQMSGLADSYDDKMLATVRSNTRHKERSFRVETRTLASIIEDQGLGTPDFISLDIEGGERAVLEAFDFDRYPVGIWAIENNTADMAIPKLMKSHGYELMEFCGPDEIYRRLIN